MPHVTGCCCGTCAAPGAAWCESSGRGYDTCGCLAPCSLCLLTCCHLLPLPLLQLGPDRGASSSNPRSSRHQASSGNGSSSSSSGGGSGATAPWPVIAPPSLLPASTPAATTPGNTTAAAAAAGGGRRGRRGPHPPAQRSVTSLLFLPGHQHTLVTAGDADPLVRFWDLRMLSQPSGVLDTAAAADTGGGGCCVAGGTRSHSSRRQAPFVPPTTAAAGGAGRGKVAGRGAKRSTQAAATAAGGGGAAADQVPPAECWLQLDVSSSSSGWGGAGRPCGVCHLAASPLGECTWVGGDCLWLYRLCKVEH
jgi:hypothetical protein